MITGATESRSSAGGGIDEGRGGIGGGGDEGSKGFFIICGAVRIGLGCGMNSGGNGAGRVGCGGNLKPTLSTFGVSSTTGSSEEVTEGSSSLSVIEIWPLLGDEVSSGTGGSGISKNSSSVESPSR